MLLHIANALAFAAMLYASVVFFRACREVNGDMRGRQACADVPRLSAAPDGNYGDNNDCGQAEVCK